MCEANQLLIYRLFEEGIKQGNFALLDTLYAPMVVDRNSRYGQLQGRSAIYLALAEVRAILLDLNVVVDKMSAEAGTVITQETWGGTHVSTGKQISGRVMHIFHIQDGEIVEEWSGGWEWLDLLSESPTSPTR